MDHALGIDASASSTGSIASSTSISVSASTRSSLSSSGLSIASTTSSTTSSATATLLTSTAVPATASGQPSSTSSSAPNSVGVPTSTPAEKSLKPRAVFAHVIVGNTYNYTIKSWATDIALAASKGIDAFALNVGNDAWEPSQVAYAYAAAGQYNAKLSGTNGTTTASGFNTTASGPFKLFLSFDMSSLPCAAATDVQPLQTYIAAYANNTSQMTYNGRVLVSTFAGEACTFGAGSLNQAWVNAVKPVNSSLPDVWFVPSFFVDPQTFPSLPVLDGAFHWNSGWPMGNYNISFAPDTSYISKLGGNRTYMAASSPWFFTHYGPDTFNKNFIYRGDDWLFAARWEQLVQNRTAVPFTEVVSWNDFGESHYVGPVSGVQPMSQAWVNGFDHQGWLDLMQYYISAYKTGAYPTITKDRVFLWGRLYPANASAPADTVGKPANYQWTQDYMWAITLLPTPANVTLSCGNTTQTTLAPAGLTKLKLPLTLPGSTASCAAKAVVARGRTTALTFAPAGYTFSARPPSYNFNAFVAASPL
ncbi:glycosyl hydrolase family 71-domain-containing protein [Trametes gibbosa]|nr:glycosyl hydrolase family 71-domain-containing protein [Trametes gibbosa]